MLQKNTSAKKFRQTLAGIGCLTLVLTVFLTAPPAAGQENLNFAEPFKKCRIYGSDNGQIQIIASDNNNDIIIANSSSELISINPLTNLENWKSRAVGKFESIMISDDNNLYFLSSVIEETNETTLVLSSISLKTGITNWQKKFINYKNIKLEQNLEKKLLFLIAENKNLQIIEKNDGNVLWTRKFPDQIFSIQTSSNGKIDVLTEKSLMFLSIKNGNLVNSINLKSGIPVKSILNEKFLLLGYPTGEIVKLGAGENKNEVQWKIKTGGSITSLIGLENEVLVSSLDNFLYLFSSENGKLKWKRRIGGRINIEPLIYGNYAVVLTSADNTASIIELREGKVVNQIEIEEDNYFSGQPFISGNFFIFQTNKGIYFFINSGKDCK